MGILGWILFGLVVGALAKLVMPGKDPGGIIVTMLLGIAGAVLGGFVGQALGFYGEGEAAGFVLRFDEGPTVYCAGDTSLFGDMRLIAEVYAPDIACLPIGDVFTMGPEDAARACEMLGVRQVLPIHYGTFPVLTGTPAELRRHLGSSGVEVLELRPGETAE